MSSQGLSERAALQVMRMSASSLRCRPRDDRNVELRAKILALAQRHRRYGVGMIYLKLRQAGLLVNYKRVERLYREQNLQVRRRKRKKVPLSERQALTRPTLPNQVWSMDFVFDRVAGGRAIKSLTIVDDATHESVAVEAEHHFSGKHLVRVLQTLCATRGHPRVIRTDNGKEFRGKDMLIWAHEQNVDLRLIEPGKPNQNAYIESFNGRLRDQCLNDSWFTSLQHAGSVIERWRREYNEERPKKSLGGLTPSQLARQLATKTVTLPAGL